MLQYAVCDAVEPEFIFSYVNDYTDDAATFGENKFPKMCLQYKGSCAWQHFWL